MMTSSNGNIFSVTGPLCGEFTGHRWIHLAKASDAGLWCFLWSSPEQTVELIIQKKARVCVSNVFVLENNKFKCFIFLLSKMSKSQRKQMCLCENSVWVERHDSWRYCGVRWLRKQCCEKKSLSAQCCASSVSILPHWGDTCVLFTWTWCMFL